METLTVLPCLAMCLLHPALSVDSAAWCLAADAPEELVGGGVWPQLGTQAAAVVPGRHPAVSSAGKLAQAADAWGLSL